MLKPSKLNSFFLFGARNTGKSFFLKQQFLKNEDHLLIDLLNPKIEDHLSKNPTELLSLIGAHPEKKWVILDEIQKVPALLDLVHLELERSSKNPHLFALTGSSARKLKRGHANLLAGRAFVYHFHPLTHLELGDTFRLDEVLNWGTLPRIYHLNSSEDRMEFLDSYTHTYLKEEIINEQLVRKTQPFRQFLEVAAQCSGQILNYSKIARDIASDATSVQNYFEILEDTLLGFQLPSFHESIRKRQRKNPKFYLFDLGVKRALQKTLNIPVTKQTYLYGVHFEHFIILEIIRLASYKRLKWNFSYLRTKDDVEIDLVIDRPGLKRALIEIKSTSHVELHGLRAFSQISTDFGSKAEKFVLSQDLNEKKYSSIFCLPWEKGLKELGLS